jgi:carbonic anhydrase
MVKNSELLYRNDIFKNSYFKKHAVELLDLAVNGQHPKALFIGCADSRVVPNLITQSAPGELFVLRNIGNFVAPFKPDGDFHSTASGIEYALRVLNVEEIIICGHTHCGAIASLYADLDESSFEHTIKWLSLGEKAKILATQALDTNEVSDALLRLTEKISVVSQIENILSYPLVKERVDAGKLHLHGWMYDIANGVIEYYDPDEKKFLLLSTSKTDSHSKES